MELVRVQDSDYPKTYELYMSFPENENGYLNNVYGYSYEQFLASVDKGIHNKKQPNMDCQPTEITDLMRHRAVFS